MVIHCPFPQVVPNPRFVTRGAAVWLSEAIRRPLVDRSLNQLLRAFDLLKRQGTGAFAWAAPFRDDPIAFVLDSMSDAVRIWSASGDLIFQNRMAARLDIRPGDGYPLERVTCRGRYFERRSLRCTGGGVDYLIEIAHEVTPGVEPAASESVAGDDH
jgi:hypothetical protein